MKFCQMSFLGLQEEKKKKQEKAGNKQNKNK